MYITKQIDRKQEKKNQIDMLNGPLAAKIVSVALPLAAISILQQLFNAADVAVVGKFASSDSLAAVGANTPIINIFLTFFTGLATGGNIAISTLIGRGKKDEIADAVHTIFSIALIGALIVFGVGEAIARRVLYAVGTPNEIMDKAVLYLRIYIIAMMFAVVYNFASAILRSKGDTKRPLYCLIASGIINVLLNLLFVIVFSMDVAGVALATLLSNAVCCIATVILLIKEEGSLKLTLKAIRIEKSPLLFTLKIGLPTGVQGMLFSVSNVIIQSGINSFGADCIAGNTAALNFEYMSYFFVSAFGQTATTFISQNYGAGKYKRCDKTFFECLSFAFLTSLFISLFFYIGKDLWLGFFTNDQNVLHFAHVRMKYVVLLECLTSFNELGAAGLRSYGISLPPMLISVLGSCALRIVWIKTIFVQINTIDTLMLVYPISWILLAIVMLSYFFVRRYQIMNKLNNL